MCCADPAAYPTSGPVCTPLPPFPLTPDSMFLASLPNVLAQSIAHFLTTKERLALARCSRHNQLLACAPFAWLHADPMTVTVHRKADGDNPPSGPFLRFLPPISLVWIGPDKPRFMARRVSRITAIAEKVHLVALQIRLFEAMDDALASQLLQDPSLKRLESLALWAHTPRLLGLACKLPMLTTLQLRSPLARDAAKLLSASPSLTDLTVSQPDSVCMSAVLRCPKLSRLAASGFCVSDLLWFSQEPRWQQLFELSLSPLDTWDNLSARTTDAALSSLRSLLVLTVSGSGLDRVLAHVHRIPTLRRLIIQCGHGCTRLPHSDAVLLSLLRSAPTLCFEWLVHPSSADEVESLLQPLAGQAGVRIMRVVEPNQREACFRLVRDA